MSAFAAPRFLPRVMWADAVSCAATGALQLVFTPALAGLTGLPESLLVATGAFLLACAAAGAWTASRAEPPRRLIGVFVAANFGWAIGCVALLAATGAALAPLGYAWVLAQAVTVVVLGELQWLGLRHTRAPLRRALAA